MGQTENSSFVFYLCLTDVLPSSYFSFSLRMKKEGMTVVPVKFDQLQKVVAVSDQAEIIVVTSIRNTQEALFYHRNVRKHLKYLLKSERITLFLLSSFSKLNDQKNHLVKRNYFFLKYPMELGLVCQLLARFLELKKEESRKWPGGKRSQSGVTV
jgi:hypothetical protein